MISHPHDRHDYQVSPIAGSLRLPRAWSVRRHFLNALKRVDFFSKFSASLTSPATDTPATSWADPVEAYLHACVAVPLFCYVSPAIYGLTGLHDEPGVPHRSSQPGDDV
jgi:hypothetical protein